jgi:hypothetical protein
LARKAPTMTWTAHILLAVAAGLAQAAVLAIAGLIQAGELAFGVLSAAPATVLGFRRLAPGSFAGAPLLGPTIGAWLVIALVVLVGFAHDVFEAPLSRVPPWALVLAFAVLSVLAILGGSVLQA